MKCRLRKLPILVLFFAAIICSAFASPAAAAEDIHSVDEVYEVLSQWADNNGGHGGGGILYISYINSTLLPNMTTQLQKLQTSVDKIDVNFNIQEEIDKYYQTKQVSGNGVVTTAPSAQPPSPSSITITTVKEPLSDSDNPGKLLNNTVLEHSSFIANMFSLIKYSFSQEDVIDSTVFQHNGYKTMEGWGVFAYLKTIAYSLVIVFFSIGLTESTLKYELMTFKGAASTFGRLLLAKIWIDLSIKICDAIIRAVTVITNQILFDPSEMINSYSMDNLFPSMALHDSNSGWWVIGKIIDFFNTLISLAPVLLCVAVIGIVAVCIIVRLYMRSVELGVLSLVSPLFFACSTSDVTKPFFRSYVTSFIQCAIHLLYMALVFSFCMLIISQISTSPALTLLGNSYYTNYYLYMVVYIVMGVLICRPPRVLTNILNG